MRRRLASCLLTVVLLGCGSQSSTPSAPPVVALYGPAATTNLTPYPSDRYAVPDSTTATGLRVSIAATTTGDPFVSAYASVATELSEMDGFSTAGGAIVSFSAPIDVTGIFADPNADPPLPGPVRDAADYAKPDAPFFLIDVDPKSPEHGKARGLVPRWWAQGMKDGYLSDEYTLVAMPATPLLPGTRYLFAVTNRVKARDGTSVARSSDTEALLAGKAGDAYGTAVTSAIGELTSSMGVKADDVVLATVFTTATVLDETLAMAKAARAAPAPPALVQPWTVETPMALPDPRVRFRAVYQAPEYRRPLPVGTWQIQGGAPVAQSQAGLEVFLAFSDGTKSGPRPVVIFQHGLGGDKDGCWGTANRLKDLGGAVIAIDSPEHGSRANGQTPLQSTFSFFGVDPTTQVFDIARARDNFRQMTSDQLELVRLIASLGTLNLLPVGAPDGVPDLDVSRILYIGHSFGSVQGPAIFALAPEITTATWNVGGDSLMMLLRDSNTFSLLTKALAPPGTPDGEMGRFFAVTQAIVNPGDGINYARFAFQDAPAGVPVWSPRDVLLQEVVDDGIVPNSTSEALARAAGLTLTDPVRAISGLPSAMAPLTGNAAGGATGAISQFDLIEGGQMATHGELIFSPEAQAQYVAFFKSGLAQKHATVAPPYPPGPHQ